MSCDRPRAKSKAALRRSRRSEIRAGLDGWRLPARTGLGYQLAFPDPDGPGEDFGRHR